MGRLQSMVAKLNDSPEIPNDTKEYLCALVNFAENKATFFESEIFKNLCSGTIIKSDFKAPITAMTLKRIEIRAANTINPDIIEETIDSLMSESKMFDCDITLRKSIFDIIEHKARMLLEAGEESRQNSFFLLAEYSGICRYDFIFWKRTIKTESLKNHIKNVLICVATKSSVDIKKLKINDFLSIYDPLLQNAFENDQTRIEKFISEAQDVYMRYREDSMVTPKKIPTLTQSAFFSEVIFESANDTQF